MFLAGWFTLYLYIPIQDGNNLLFVHKIQPKRSVENPPRTIVQCQRTPISSHITTLQIQLCHRKHAVNCKSEMNSFFHKLLKKMKYVYICNEKDENNIVMYKHYLQQIILDK